MKKYLFLFLVIFVIFFSGCSDNKENDIKILNEVLNTITLPEETNENLILPKEFYYQDYKVIAKWNSTDYEHLTNDGIISQDIEEDIYVTLDLELSLNEQFITHSFDIIILPKDDSQIANEILELISTPSTIDNDYVFPIFVNYNEMKYRITWESSDKNIIDENLNIAYNQSDKSITMQATIKYNRVEYEKKFNIVVSAFNTEHINEYLNTLSIPEELENNLNLIDEYQNNNDLYKFSWKSNKENVLSNDGKKGLVLNDTDVVLTLIVSIGNVLIEKEFRIRVSKSTLNQIDDVINDVVHIQPIITNNIFLVPSIFDLITLSWTSSNESVISNKGIINQNLAKPTTVILTVNYMIGENEMSKEYKTVIAPVQHLYKSDKFEGEFNGTELNSKGNIVLQDNVNEGTFISKEYDHPGFYEAIGSWNALTSSVTTCEFLVSLKVNGTYSDYISYGQWGLGLKNKCVSQTNSLIKLSDDEIKVLNNKNAEGFKYKIILRRKNVTDKTPIVFFVSLAFNIKNYSYSFDKSLVKNETKYDVPKLYQHDVPIIGNSICSITSSTMLLKYKGHDFTKYNSLEHEYIAELFKDYGNNIYGNWVYNCVGMGSYGERAYVKRFADTYEFLYSLQEIGPMAASISGTVKYTKLSTNTNSSYTTNGHLIVVTGYEITDDNTYIYINDPNVSGVAVKMELTDFLNVWRNIGYIVE